MTIIVLIGAGLGVGLWVLVSWLVPPRPALAVAIARSAAPTPHIAPSGSWWLRLAAPGIRALRAVGLPSAQGIPDLRLLSRGADDHLAEKLVLAVVGFLIPVLGTAAATVLGAGLDLRAPVLLAVACAVGGYLMPDARVRKAARSRRADFRHALSAYLDLVVISLAGGAGVDSAMNESAAIGHGQAFDQLRRALAAARLTRHSPWTTLRQLGDELAVPELSEVAASLSLAGMEGAKVRNSLAAKATSLRTRQLTEAESQASSQTERMSLPIVLLFLGFLIFIAYPAAHQVLNGL